MTVILQDSIDRTEIVACGPEDDAIWRRGMCLVQLAVPRSTDGDRDFISLLSDRNWHGVILSGVETPADIEKASTLLRVAEAHRNLKTGSLLIVAVLDTAKAALGLAAFHRAIPRLAGLAFDARALACASGAAADSDLVADLRLRLPLAARACGVTAILKVRERTPAISSASARDGYHGLWLERA